MADVRELCSYERRLAGTDAERRAANHLARRLRELGRRAEVEPTYVHPQFALVHAIHCALGIAGSLLALSQPAIGFALVLAAAASMYLDLNGRLYVVRQMFFRRASQNVLSRAPARRRSRNADGEDRDQRCRVVLCAHYDAPRTGAAFSARWRRRAARLQSVVPLPTGPFRLLFWSLMGLLPLLGLRMAGIEEDWLSALQLPPTLVLVVGVFLLVDVELSDVVPAANDNASGVATVLAATAELDAHPPENLDVWVLFTGAEQTLQEGMRSFVHAHRRDLDRDSTWFLNVDTVGDGDVRWEASAGWVVSFRMDRRLAELCEAIATADRESPEGDFVGGERTGGDSAGERRGRYGAAPLHSGSATDSLPPRLAGYPAITITCRDERGAAPRARSQADVPDELDPQSMARAQSFVCKLVRRLDSDVGRRFGD